MGNLKDTWTGFDGFRLGPEHKKKIQTVLDTANFPFLSETALEIRRTQDESVRALSKPLTCSIDTSKFAYGQCNVVFEVEFSDSISWIARIRLPTESTADDEVETSIRSEITTMKLVSSKTSIPLPEIRGFDISLPNAFGYRYILMDALPGRILSASFSRSVPRIHWDAFASQLASIYYQLSCLRFSSIGSITEVPGKDSEMEIEVAPYGGDMGPFSSSLEYFYAERKWDSQMNEEQHPNDEQWATASWILEQALPFMVVEDLVRGPFPLCHLDLHYNNILVDDDFRITGVVDWSNVQTVPLERFMITPEFALVPNAPAEDKARTVELRDVFAQKLREMELAARDPQDEEAPKTLLADLLGTSRWEVTYRCTHSHYWRALTDARLVMDQLYGPESKWEDFVTFFKKAPITRKIESDGEGAL